MRESVEAFLERERGQLPPWFVVGFGTGIAAWFALGQPRDWAAFLCVSAALALFGFSLKGEADIVVSSRWLPRGCTTRWLKLDRDSLGRTGGVAVYLGSEPGAVTSAERIGKHPWTADVPRRMRYGPRVRNKDSADAPIRDRT